jgi:omega-amidase
MRIALVQMAVREGDAEANLSRARGLLADAPAAELYLLPELWTSGYAHDRWETLADHSSPAVREWMLSWARERRAWLGGTLIARTDNGGLANRFHLAGPDGQLVLYDKGHLFAPLREDLLLEAGRARVRTTVEDWTAALSICFDLRFPGQYRRDAVEGAEVFLVSSAWPEPRCSILRALAQARAMENQAVLALCNRTGPDGAGGMYCGHSALFGPGGEIVVEAGSDEGVHVAELDRGTVEAARRALPVLSLEVPALDR